MNRSASGYWQSALLILSALRQHYSTDALCSPWQRLAEMRTVS
jgi:hypothetical protein